MIPNVYNVTCRTPMIEFSSKTTSFAGLVEDVKRREICSPPKVLEFSVTDKSCAPASRTEMIKSLWSQKG